MTKNLNQGLRLAAVLLLLASVPSAAGREAIEAPALPRAGAAETMVNDCEDYDNENGFGGTVVYCDLTCRTGAVLTVSVRSHDDNADVEGKVDCGGAEGTCSGHEFCQGAANELAGRDESGQDNCWGRSYEFSDSGVTLSCMAAGSATVCKLVPELCAPQLDVREVCLAQDPGLASLGDEVLDVLFGPTPKAIHALVGAHWQDDVGIWVAFGDGVCTTGIL